MRPKNFISENSKTHNIRFITRKNCFHVCRLKVETIFKPLTYNQTLVNEYLSVMQKAAVDTHDSPGLLVIIIHEARYLSDDQLTGEPYVSLLFRGELRKTKVNHYYYYFY